MIHWSQVQDWLLTESRRIVSEGGSLIPEKDIIEFLDVYRDSVPHYDADSFREKVQLFLNPYLRTIPRVLEADRAKLKTAALQSSRLTRLRQSRGLPFKSRRQP